MKATTVMDMECWGCGEITTCLRFYGRSGHRRMDICMWCMGASMELLTGFGMIRALRQWQANRNASVETNGPNQRRFSLKGTRRFRHEW